MAPSPLDCRPPRRAAPESRGRKRESIYAMVDFGPGVHGLASMAAGLPQALTWLWRDYDPKKTEQVCKQEKSEKAKPLFRVKIYSR